MLEANLELLRRGLVLYTFGHVSGILREQGLVVIKPRGAPNERMKPAHLVVVDLKCKVVQGKLRPSSVGLIKPEPMSFARFSTDDTAGRMRGYVGEGRFTDDPLNTFGGAGVVEIPELQKLLHFICERGFEQHVAANLSTVASAVYEANTRYLGWDVCYHGQKNGAC